MMNTLITLLFVVSTITLLVGWLCHHWAKNTEEFSTKERYLKNLSAFFMVIGVILGFASAILSTII